MASKPCLPVSRRRKAREDAPVEFDDISSMDATEYLSRVMQQSQRLPEIMHRSSEPPQPQSNKHQDHVPIEGSAASLSYLISNRTAILPPPSAAHLPAANGAAWVDQTLANFSQLRLFFEKARQQQQQKQQQQQQQTRRPVPAMKDRPGWHIFCLGETEARGNTGSYFADDDNDDNDKGGAKDSHANKEDTPGKEGNTNQAAGMKVEETGDAKEGNATMFNNTEVTNREPWQENLPENGVYPSTTMMLQLDQVMIRKVIAHLAHYVQDGWYPCSMHRTLWLYALLARLEKPIHRNDAAVLYGLLKALTRARATLPSLVQDDREGLARLNVLITIVGIYFEQGGGYAGVMEVK